MRTLSSYYDDIKKNLNNPHLLAELATEAAGEYCYFSEALGRVKISKAVIWIKIKCYSNWREIIDKKSPPIERDKYLSDKLTEQIWRTTKEGITEVDLRIKLNALEKIISSVRSHIFVLNQESKNQI